MRIDVSVGLSLEPRSAPRAGETEESVHVAAPGRGPRRGRILVMEDNPMVRETMRRQLVICGYEVTVVARGEDAVSAYVQARDGGRPFAAVILDLKVDSGWGGEQTLVELLRLDPGLRALVCSGTLEAPKEHYRNMGFGGVLGKPYSLADLRGEVEAVLLGREGVPAEFSRGEGGAVS
ncbi:MAG: response regulator [Candidatus Methylomirabilia bacterium]